LNLLRFIFIDSFTPIKRERQKEKYKYKEKDKQNYPQLNLRLNKKN